jgi:hypothetical protein
MVAANRARVNAAAPVRAVVLAVLLSGCGSGGRDVIPETHDVIDIGGSGAGAGASAIRGDADGGAADTYQHVARRRHGVLALAEGRGFAPGEAEHAVDQLADAFEACATARQQEGKLVNGAVRVVARVNPSGEVDGWTVRAAPGPAVAANVLMCILAPLRAASFGPGGPRGLALESDWSPQR